MKEEVLEEFEVLRSIYPDEEELKITNNQIEYHFKEMASVNNRR